MFIDNAILYSENYCFRLGYDWISLQGLSGFEVDIYLFYTSAEFQYLFYRTN